jgi:hypothetical protein
LILTHGHEKHSIIITTDNVLFFGDDNFPWYDHRKGTVNLVLKLTPMMLNYKVRKDKEKRGGIFESIQAF